MNGVSASPALEEAFSALQHQVEAHLQAGLPRLLNYLWQPLVPFLMVPTPALGLIAVIPEKSYCQIEHLAEQSITLTPLSDAGVSHETSPGYFQLPFSMKIYPLQWIEQEKQCVNNDTRLIVTLKNINLQRSIQVDQGLQFSISGDEMLAVAFWQQLVRCEKVLACVQHETVSCSVEILNQTPHSFQNFIPPLLHYGLAPKTILLIKINLNSPLTVSVSDTVKLVFEWSDILDNQQLNAKQVRLVLNSSWILNAYETDAIPIRNPKNLDTHWVKPLQEEVAEEEVLSIASIHGMSGHVKQALPAALSTYPRSDFSSINYYAFYEGRRLGLQLSGNVSDVEWLSVSIWAHQSDKPLMNLLPGKIAGDLSDNPPGWNWEILARFTPVQRNQRLPERYTDLSWLSAPLQLFQTESILREYLELFAIKAPGLLKKIAAIEKILCEKNQIFQNGTFQLQLVLHWQMDLRAFDSIWDCQLFLQSVYWQLAPLVPYAYQLEFSLSSASTQNIWHWPC
jgi:hypothetical protein